MPTADVKLVCGACGASVSSGARECGGCGAVLRYPEIRPGGDVRCPACGFAQSGEGSVCVSCGAALRPGRKGSQKARPRPSREGSGTRKGTEPWMVVAGISILLLLTYVIYTAVTAPPAPTGSSPGAPAALPPGSPLLSGPRVDLAPLEDAVRRNPKDPAALLRLANALHDGGEWDRAVETYQRFLAGTPGNPDARVDMAICYFEASKSNAAKREEYHARAVAEMCRVMKEHPRHQAAAFNLGIVTLQSGDVAGANAWFTRAVEIDPVSPLGQRAKSILQEHTITN